MKIITGANNPILRKIAEPVTSFDKKLQKLVKDMEAMVRESNGVGLAAPQVGISKRFFLTQLSKRFVALVNPEITHVAAETEVKEEGCLSLPEIFGDVRRPVAIRVKFQDLSGKPMQLELEGMDARVVQHEYDHLNAVLFIDRIEGGLKTQTQSSETTNA